MRKQNTISYKKDNIIISLYVIIFLLIPIISFPVTRNVPSEYATIQSAINASADGDEIIVAQGTYKENINFNGKNIILRSTDPTSSTVVAATIIDGNQKESVVTFSGTESIECVLEGFTITNGKAIYGGGINGNWNIALIQNNIIIGNSCPFDGGGLFGCNGIIQNNTIAGNSADFGGGLSNCNGFIVNCIIWNNSDHSYPQIYLSSTPIYSCIQDWTGGGVGNIKDDPKFVDPVNNNFHLQPDSPCIDKGNLFYVIGENIRDIDGECRLAGISVDMGCDEYGSYKDTDGDLLSDVEEVNKGTNPDKSDTDEDGLIDGIEVLRGTNPVIKDTLTGISVPAKYPSIQRAIFMAFAGEKITVSTRSYKENLYFGGKNIILQSLNPDDKNIVQNTIIDGSKIHSVITFKGSENAICSISGFTICNGKGHYGGGINVMVMVLIL